MDVPSLSRQPYRRPPLLRATDPQRMNWLWRLVCELAELRPADVVEALHAAQIPVADRWAIIAYVKSEQMKKDPSVPQEPGGVAAVVVTTADAATGEKLYKAKGCNACHSIDGTRVVGPTWKGLWGKTEKTSAGDVVVDLAYLTESIVNPMAKIADGYPPAMPAQQLTEPEIKSIALYMETLK